MGVIGDLLDKAHGDEKGNLSKEDQGRYNKALTDELQQNGVNEETVFYIVSGIKFGSVNAFGQWNKGFSQDEQTDNIEKIISSHKAQSLDNVSKLRMFFSLLVSELNEKEVNDTAVGDILYCLDDASYKKDGGRLTDIGRLFKSCFLTGMRADTKLPNLAKYNFSPDYEGKLLVFFDEVIGKIEPKGDVEIDKRNALRRWIEKQHQVLDKNDKNTEPNNTAPQKEKTEVIETDSSNKKQVEKSEEKAEEKVEIRSTLGKKLFEIAKVMDTLDDDFRDVEKRLKEKEREISRLKTSQDKLQNLYQAGIDENANLKKQLSEITARNEALEKENLELNDRVNRQISVIDVYDQDKANTKTELLNQIAASLKKIYDDYKVAENMEMTIELGENMRDSLDDVFRKMKKLGIDIEGR